MSVQHFLTLNDLSRSQLQALIDRAIELKREHKRGAIYEPLKNKTLAMIFTKSSTRTRVSFEAGMQQFGGGSIVLTPGDTQLGRGEPISDTAKVISTMVDGIMIRTSRHADIQELASNSQVPVINGLTDAYHPCQLLADVQTMQELRGDVQGAKVAWVGDGNNVCHSFVNAAIAFDFSLTIATPEGYEPVSELVDLEHANISVGHDVEHSLKGADFVVTDTWASMGQEQEKVEREKAFANYCVDQAKMKMAATDAVFLHCLPAYRGMEVSAEVIDGPQSAVIQEAENRLHAQKALLELLLV